jgi:GNAT superfamily N-acetyltransferase
LNAPRGVRTLRAMEWTRDGYRISTDPAELDLEVLHGFLRNAYWSPGVPREVIARSIEHSLNFGLYENGDQVGFARVVTDCATFAWLADVFVLEPHRRRGLGVWLVETVLAHPDLQGLRRHMLATADAHKLYARFGFTRMAGSDRFMTREQEAAALYAA